MDANGSPPQATGDLNGLYKQLNDLELMDRRLFEDICSMECSECAMHWWQSCDSDGDEQKHLVGKALRHQVETIRLLRPILDDLRQRLRMDVNTCSRPNIRSLTIMDMPDEILAEIFDFVRDRFTMRQYFIDIGPPGDVNISNVRLTCKRFCTASSHLLVHLVRLEFSQESLSNLTKISSHPLISKGIYGVDVSLRFYPADMASDIGKFARYHFVKLSESIEGFERALAWMWKSDSEGEKTAVAAIRKMRKILKSWAVYLKFDPDQPTTSFAARLRDGIVQETKHSLNLLILKKAHALYQQRFSQQRGLLKKNILIDAVSDAFSKMPIACRLQLHDRDYRWKSVDRSHWMNLNKDPAELTRYMVCPMSLEDARKEGFQAPGRLLRMPITLPISIHKAGTWITSFSIQLSNPRDFSCLSMSESDCSQLQAAMQILKAFEFRPESHRSDNFWPERSEAEMKCLEDYMGTVIDTNTVEEIFISVDSLQVENEVPNFNMGGLISLRSWPKLGFLWITGLSFQLADIEKFTQQTQGSVRVLNIISPYLLSGTWLEVLDTLRVKAQHTWSLERPRGAECDDLTKEEYERVFHKSENYGDKYSAAESFVRRWSKMNPLGEGGLTSATITNGAQQ